MDTYGRHVLHYAAMEDDLATIRREILAGGDLNVTDAQGFSPLHLAAQEYSLSVARELLAAGASVNALNTWGNNPLFVAVFNSRGRGEMIGLLRQNGADPLSKNTAGQTPVGLARLIGNYNVAQYFEDLP